jgi:cold shock CspA family protein
MAITVLSKSSPTPQPGGQQGVCTQKYVCSWTTTDTTGTVPSGMRKVLFVDGFTFLQEVASDEEMFVSSTINGDGSVTLDTGQVITFGRIGMQVTSGLKFSFTIEGYV